MKKAEPETEELAEIADEIGGVAGTAGETEELTGTADERKKGRLYLIKQTVSTIYFRESFTVKPKKESKKSQLTSTTKTLPMWGRRVSTSSAVSALLMKRE
jgi:hypothetical protein